jgi:RNA polymerase sigma-32 factor
MTSSKDAAVASDAEGLSRYLRQIQSLPMLDADQERELSRRWRAQHDGDAARQLVASHLRLVAKIAFRYRGYGFPVSDLISEGNVGMMEAVRRFDPELGFRFACYARWWVRAAIRAYILRSWSLVKVGTTVQQKRLFFHLRRLESKMQIVMHDADLLPSHVTTIADALGVPKQAVVDMHRRLGGKDRSLDAPMHPGREGTWEDSLADSSDLESAVTQREERAVRRAMLPTALGTLDQRQRHILIERRLKERPAKLEKLADHYGVSAERIRQIENRAFEKLRKAMQLQMLPPIERQAECRRAAL